METEPAGRTPCLGCACYSGRRHERPWFDRITNVRWGGDLRGGACGGCHCSGQVRHHYPGWYREADDTRPLESDNRLAWTVGVAVVCGVAQFLNGGNDRSVIVVTVAAFIGTAVLVYGGGWRRRMIGR